MCLREPELTYISTWPNFYPVTAVNMNYSTVVLAGWVFFGVVYYVFSGRKRYSGPLIELDGVSGTVRKSSRSLSVQIENQ